MTGVRAIAVFYVGPESETPKLIDTNFCMIDYIGEISGCAENHNNLLSGGAATDTTFCTYHFLR